MRVAPTVLRQHAGLAAILWSSAAAKAIGFPDPARDADLLSRARRTATGGWVVQLTDAPLDLDDPAHFARSLPQKAKAESLKEPGPRRWSTIRSPALTCGCSQIYQ
ncbi:DUF5953 family protein [Pyxidicoccus xibeiensis]|uniref:DUF5953 family protein n=1 Tax=Pyxidicoccus xibeiensis TaxID=2906759 RepID=UPI0020A796A6|nr:DUF5953 family protein [Pyxidicoccus xibeiensis]MCP3140207.1 DUF5953 family protein [Pyxidicoccus xibeiensis]